ncbi:MAG: hypothetical protein WEB60_10195 [Terrimicrobiaceae bacterium]
MALKTTPKRLFGIFAVPWKNGETAVKVRGQGRLDRVVFAVLEGSRLKRAGRTVPPALEPVRFPRQQGHLAKKLDGTTSKCAKWHAGFPARSLSKRNGHASHTEIGIPVNQSGKRHIRKHKRCGNLWKKTCHRFCPHQAIGNVGIRATHPIQTLQRITQNFAGHDSLQPIFTNVPNAINHIKLRTLGPQGREKCRVTLTVRIDLKNPFRTHVDRCLVAFQTGLSVPPVGVSESFYAPLRFDGQILQNLRRPVGGSIIQNKKNKRAHDPFDLKNPFPQDPFRGLLLIKNGNNNGQNRRLLTSAR